jgi:hypothetical protein
MGPVLALWSSALAGVAMQDPLPQQVQLGAAVHGPFQQFEAIDLPFRLPLRMSGQLYPMT